jgi:predicted kinase
VTARPPVLVFLTGKMAAGKTTRSRELAAREDAIRLAQDELVEVLFPGLIVDMPTFFEYSRRLHAALTPHVRALLAKGVSVVMDFPGNTRQQRAWFRELVEGTGARLELHWVDAADDVCKQQLRARSAHLPPDTPWTRDADFDLITAYFEPPADDEGFTIVRYRREPGASA